MGNLHENYSAAECQGRKGFRSGSHHRFYCKHLESTPDFTLFMQRKELEYLYTLFHLILKKTLSLFYKLEQIEA